MAAVARRRVARATTLVDETGIGEKGTDDATDRTER
jgi:hypothetical protein